MKGADFVWDKEKLDSFIAKPDEVVPGNSMKPYGGLASAEDRSKLIAFLQSPVTNGKAAAIGVLNPGPLRGDGLTPQALTPGPRGNLRPFLLGLGGLHVTL
jgi:hypothetical protein